jgi:hypothetical protein
MIRNLKALGVALVAMAALGAVIASGASAQFTAAEYPASLTGNQIGGGHSFETAAGTLTCTTAHFTGTLSGKSPEVTIEPEYTGCAVTSGPLTGAPVTVTMNGCDYLFTQSGTVTSDTAEDIVHLICPGSNKIQIHVYTNATKHAEGVSLCSYTVGPQTIGNIHYENHTPNVITVEARASNVAITRDGSILCGAASQTAVYRGNTEVTAKNGAGEPINGDIG